MFAWLQRIQFSIVGWGRPVQAIEAGETPLQMIHRIERVIVDANNPQSVRLLDLSSQPMIPELRYDDPESDDNSARAAIDRKPVGRV